MQEQQQPPDSPTTPSKTIGQIIDEHIANLQKIIGNANTTFSKEPRERAVLVIVLPLAAFALLVAIVLRNNGFVSGIFSNIATEMLGAFIIYWLLYGGLAGLSSKEDSQIEELEKRLVNIQEKIDRLSAEPHEKGVTDRDQLVDTESQHLTILDERNDE